MLVEIITPDATLFSGQAEAVILPGMKGTFQILKDHAPIVSTLSNGNVVVEIQKGTTPELIHKDIVQEGQRFSVAVDGGTIELQGSKLIILAE